MTPPFWIHEGVYYGKDGGYVGSYYNNDGGWWWRPMNDTAAHQAKSRLDAIRKLERVDLATRSKRPASPTRRP